MKLYPREALGERPPRDHMVDQVVSSEHVVEGFFAFEKLGEVSIKPPVVQENVKSAEEKRLVFIDSIPPRVTKDPPCIEGSGYFRINLPMRGNYDFDALSSARVMNRLQIRVPMPGLCAKALF